MRPLAAALALLSLVALLPSPARADGDPRSEFVIAGFGAGVLSGLSGAAALGVDARFGSGLVLAGGLGGAAAAWGWSLGHPVTPAMPVMLGSGLVYGVSSALAFLAIADVERPWGAIFTGSVVGSLGGLGYASALDMTGGDAGASGFFAVFLGVETFLGIAAGAQQVSRAAQLVVPVWLAASVGFFGGPFANRQLHFSRVRWGEIGAIAAGGGLAGLLVASLLGAQIRPVLVTGMVGAVVGALVAVPFTSFAAPDSASREGPAPVRFADLPDTRPLERRTSEPGLAGVQVPLAAMAF